ncbi:MAG: hypothetical protein K1X55_10065 [Chitinophagales bacterium]|nr:hypothetical protein [Chitinophagales bacterium]
MENRHIQTLEKMRNDFNLNYKKCKEYEAKTKELEEKALKLEEIAKTLKEIEKPVENPNNNNTNQQ